MKYRLDVSYVANLEVLHDGAVRVPRCLFCLSLVRCPEREVVAQELHDEGGVLVRLLGKRVELRNRVVKRLCASKRQETTCGSGIVRVMDSVRG